MPISGYTGLYVDIFCPGSRYLPSGMSITGRRTLSLWWLPYSIWAGLVFLLVLVLGAMGYLFLSLLSPAKGRERRLLYINQIIAVIWAGLCGMRLRLEKHPEIDSRQSYVFTPNHSSTLDVMIGSFAFRYGMRFLVKEELRRVPLLGFMFSRIGIFVQRDRAESRRQTRETLRRWAAQGVSFCLFPEGTRNRSDEPLGRFYDGAFDAAVSAQIPIAPMVFLGVRSLMPMGSRLLRPGTMTAVYLKPISTFGLTLDDVPRLREEVFDAMYRVIVERDPAFRQA